MCRRLLGLVLVCLMASANSTASAQELRVYTRTIDLARAAQDKTARPVIVARSLTLFHAGKVYDYIDSLREVTIFEPSHRQFTIVNESAASYTQISQDEVRRFLGLAEDRVQEVAADLTRSGAPEQQSALRLLQFQLRPNFEVSYESARRDLHLRAPQFLYEVRCAEAPQAVVVDSYLKYANAISELNSVLHPHSLLPGPRQELNRQLQERGLLPVSVRRRSEFGEVVDLRADHEWAWTLTEHDRQFIDRWESQLSRKELRQLPFEQMQREVLTGKLTQR